MATAKSFNFSEHSIDCINGTCNHDVEIVYSSGQEFKGKMLGENIYRLLKASKLKVPQHFKKWAPAKPKKTAEEKEKAKKMKQKDGSKKEKTSSKSSPKEKKKKTDVPKTIAKKKKETSV